MGRVGTLDAIYPISALTKKQKEVKEAAEVGIVRITDQGVGAYIFASEEAYEREIKRILDQALYEERMAEGIRRGVADIESGRVVDDVDAFFDHAEKGLSA